MKLAAPGQSQCSKSPLVKLDPLGPEQVARPAPPGAVARSDDEDRLPGIAKKSATPKGDAGSSWSRDGGATSAAVAAAAAHSFTEAPPLEIAKQSATTLNSRRFLVRQDLLGPRAGGTTSTAEGAADAKSVAEARPRGIERLGVYFGAWARVDARLLRAGLRSGSGVMLPRPF